MNAIHSIQTTQIERNGTGIERTGTGIERNGTGIERNGTGIERNGTGIRRFGNSLAVAMVVVASGLVAGVPAPAQAELVSMEASAQAIPTTVLVKGERVSLVVGGSECSLTGTGYQIEGYARFPLTYRIGEAGESIRVHGSGSGDKIHGSGSGGKIHGSGSGAPDEGDGTDAMRSLCSAMFQHFSVSDLEPGSGNAAPAQLWGEAEISLDRLKNAAVIVYPLDEYGRRMEGVLMETTVLNQ